MGTLTFFLIIIVLSILQTFLGRYTSKAISLIAPSIWVICMVVLYFMNKISLPILIIGTIVGILILSFSRVSSVENHKKNRNRELEDMKKKDF